MFEATSWNEAQLQAEISIEQDVCRASMLKTEGSRRLPSASLKVL